MSMQSNLNQSQGYVNNFDLSYFRMQAIMGQIWSQSIIGSVPRGIYTHPMVLRF